MLLRPLRQWVLGGVLSPDLDPLPVDASILVDDHLEEYSDHIQSVVTDFEGQVAALQRRRAAEQVPVPSSDPARGDAEMKNHVKAMLPTLDALDRIIDYGDAFEKKDDTFDNWLTSIRALRTRLMRSLEGVGLTAISSVGNEVDFEIHDVVAVVPAGKYPANTVVSEQQRGYFFRGKLLRDAKIVAAQ